MGVIKPPLGGGTLVSSGKWTWNDGAKKHQGEIKDADVSFINLEIAIRGGSLAEPPARIGRTKTRGSRHDLTVGV